MESSPFIGKDNRMQIIISPAKKMVTDTDSFACTGFPLFLPQATQLVKALQSMHYDQLKALWKCSDAIVQENMQRLQQMHLEKAATPAILAYDGIQYKHMAPGVFTYEELDYITAHLRILSGLYGLLRPFDAITPYRLEMQAKLAVNGTKDLYGFWGDTLAQALCQESDCILNLASKEYSQCIAKHLPQQVRFITCMFAQQKGDKLVERAPLCKMARGEMVRFLAERNITDPEGVKAFSYLNFRFAPQYSTPTQFIFIQED